MQDNLTPQSAPSEQEQPAEVQPAAQTPPAADTPLWQPDADTDESETPARGGVSKKWMIIGGILFVFLAAAVFLGAQLLKPPTTAEGENGGGPGLIMMGGKGGPGGAKSVRIQLTPAPELPTEQPITSGLFVKREDQSIFIGTGNVRMTAKKQAGSNSPDDISSNYDGPVVEVVISHETKVYQDATDMTPPDESNNSGVVTMQQVVKPGSLDDVGKNSMITVWGEKHGDRIDAKAIIFR